MAVTINRREGAALINSLTAGVVPRIGLRHIAVGRQGEINAFLNDLATIEDGGAAFRFICGQYGSGKSFLLQTIRNNVMTVSAHMVGSGARNMETQNAHEPIDLDYNLNIDRVYGLDINRDTNKIKDYIMAMFNSVLKKHGWSNCQDSTSALTTERRHFTKGNQTEFSIDLAIVAEGRDGAWFRLIHEKTGFVQYDRWYWNEGPQSKGLNDKVDWLKDNHLWLEVRETYLTKKNRYLSRGDRNHPSFNCYIEAVNEVFHKYR